MVQKQAEKQIALKLRGKGLSYREILQKVPVSKSTLSLWLRSVNLSKKQKQRLTAKKLAAMKRGWEKVHLLRMQRWERTKTEALKDISKLTKRERFLLGIALYWAEGSKEKYYHSGTNIKFSNSDPLMIVVFRKWLNEFSKAPIEKIKFELYIHERGDLKKALKFWSSALNVPKTAFRVYFKRNNLSPKRKNIGKEYNGLVRIHVPNSITLVRKIDGWVQGICKHWGVV
ncbi:MAG: hypothetical protein COU46_01045 [Candidatus Niyogibacteria bacterium CG10_big_fil_rev_8_21_14_0_10_42_19]|uniref:Uncharacterized protein n=1 Tax=Candidatus Niyogibacteria bacterium CG10_big_fil_rev_8_21_14_0_10_42_19 TaxID=1974725 RepID=A0A2H0TG23_9BACT|nr:MAG: hypothetical protein COU46_01045 [Candidatus Niyogibacteria bacterium CG10_big_fil_rev_8_21_14_0_10_42_19]